MAPEEDAKTSAGGPGEGGEKTDPKHKKELGFKYLGSEPARKDWTKGEGQGDWSHKGRVTDF